ncbi:MAG: glycosyltransferase family 4 protein [Candidatus Paceibacterota bacterium]|jgi:glycosyltransferase involved in cell wall biosynthesis
MKIIILLEQFVRSGANKPLLDDVLFLRQQNVDARIVTFFPEIPGDTFYDDSSFSKESFSCLRFGHWWDPREWKKLKLFLSQEKPDLVIAGDGTAKTIGLLTARFSHVPKIFAFAHDEENIRLSESFFDRFFYLLPDKIIVAFQSAKEKLLARGAMQKKIVILTDGFIPEAYGKRYARDIRKDLGIGESEFIFICVGELTIDKGTDVLLRAFAKIPDGRLLIVGDGAEKNSLESLSNNLGLQERVIFLPQREDIPSLLMEAGAMIVPSKKEEFASSLVMGLLSGLPIITSDFPGAEEMIRNGENGIIVRKQDSDVLAEAMKTIAVDAELRASLQKNTGKGMEKFSIANHCAKLLSLMEEKK